jgi:hypothetical protein
MADCRGSSEAVMLRESDLHLPTRGWGRIVLAASASRAGTAWTDRGTAWQERGLKHRAEHETPTLPIPPELVKLLRAHIRRYGTTPDGRIFQTARGGILQDSAYIAVWAEAPVARSAAAVVVMPANWYRPEVRVNISDLRVWYSRERISTICSRSTERSKFSCGWRF